MEWAFHAGSINSIRQVNNNCWIKLTSQDSEVAPVGWIDTLNAGIEKYVRGTKLKAV